MDNQKIITVEKNTEISKAGEATTFKTSHTQNFIVIAETETHFFFKDDKHNRLSVWKDNIKNVTFKIRTILFKDLKKDEILNILDNHRKLIVLSQKMSKIISQYDIEQYDMSIYDPEHINIGTTKSHIILSTKHLDKGKSKEFSCKIPKQFLWDHSWRKNLRKYLNDKYSTF